MADYKGLTIKFTGDDSDLTRALMNIESKAGDTQKSLALIGSGKGLMLKQGGDALQAFGRSISNIGDKLTIVSAAMLMTFGRKMVQDVQEFGNEVSKIGGYLGIAGSELEEMRDLALKFGKDTQYSATEAAEAISELAKGGLDQAQISGGALEATLHLAAAGQMDFASAAKVTSQALHAFRLEGDDAEHVADALAAAATNSVASVEGLANGFAYAASWARNAGWDINEVSGALALLSNYGIDAEMAGTALRNFMLRLAAPTDKAAGIMADLGIEVRDASGNMKSAVEVVDELNNALSGLSADDRDVLINAIFGVRGANAALALMDAGSQELQKYIGYTYDVGAAARMAQAQMGELGWAIELMRGEAETASVNFMSSLEPTLIKLANAAEDLFSWFNELSDAERDNVVQMALLAVGAGPILSVAGRLISGFGGVASALGSLTMGVSGFIKAAKAGGDASKAFTSFLSAANMVDFASGAEMASTALAGLRVGIVGLGAAAALAAIGLIATELYKEAQEAERVQNRLELAKDATYRMEFASRDSIPSIQKYSDAYKELGDTVDTSAEAVDRLLESHLSLADQMQERNKAAQETIDKLATAWDILGKYAGAESLAADEAGKLQWALDIVNQETGHNYELMYAYSGVIGENGEKVDNLVESLDELIDARIREAQAAAISANLTDAYTEQYELERQQVAVEEELLQKRERLDRLLAKQATVDYGSDTWWELQGRINRLEPEIAELERSYDGLTGAISDNAAAIDYYTEKYAEIQGTIDTFDEKVAQILHVAGQDVFSGLGDRAEEFTNRFDKALGDVNASLEKNGQAQLDYTSFTAEQWSALITALNADGYMMEDMLALVTGDLSIASDEWKATVEKWAEDNGIAAEDAMKAIVDGIADGSADVSNGLQGVLDSSLGRAKQYAESESPDVGKKMDEGAASGAESNRGIVGDAAQRVAEYARDRMSGVDFSTSGYDMMSSFANGIWSGFSNLVTPAVNAVTQYIADNVKHSKPKTGPLSTDDVWGRHMVENFANGMKAGLPYLEREVDSMTSTLAWGLNDQSLYMSAGNGYRGGTAIYIDGNAIVTDARLQGAAESFMREVVRKSDM